MAVECARTTCCCCCGEVECLRAVFLRALAFFLPFIVRRCVNACCSISVACSTFSCCYWLSRPLSRIHFRTRHQTDPVPKLSREKETLDSRFSKPPKTKSGMLSFLSRASAAPPTVCSLVCPLEGVRVCGGGMCSHNLRFFAPSDER